VTAASAATARGLTGSLPDRIASLAMPATALVLLGALAWTLWIARSWPLIHDASIMHYMVFLMDHGLAPYRDVPDINMPGAHLSEALVMHTLGGGAAGWRLWDLILGLLAVGACVWIAGPRLRWAGLAAGAFGYLTHLADGAMNLGQRDWLVAVLLLGALGCLTASLRSGNAAWIGAAALMCGLATSIKPHVLLVGLAFFAVLCWLIRPGPADRRFAVRGGLGAATLWAFAGMIPPTVMVVAYLSYWRAWPAFLDIMHTAIPWYAGLQRTPIAEVLGSSMWQLVTGAGLITAFWPSRRERGWDLEWAFLGVAGGFALFLIQGKGWAYHRYTETVFLALWASVACARALQGGLLAKVSGVAGLVLCALLGLGLAWRASIATYPARNLPSLERDLQRLGGPALSGKVQCLDMVMGGCITALYDLKLVSATGLIGDPVLFPDHPSAVTDSYRKQFAQTIAERPPQVIVISSYSWPSGRYTYDKLRNWPAFTAALAQRYHLAHEVTTTHDGVGYRLYVRNGVAAPP
jgi:hypothetical protein